jgi:hypothetical protein
VLGRACPDCPSKLRAHVERCPWSAQLRPKRRDSVRPRAAPETAERSSPRLLFRVRAEYNPAAHSNVSPSHQYMNDTIDVHDIMSHVRQQGASPATPEPRPQPRRAPRTRAHPGSISPRARNPPVCSQQLAHPFSSAKTPTAPPSETCALFRRRPKCNASVSSHFPMRGTPDLSQRS